MKKFTFWASAIIIGLALGLTGAFDSIMDSAFADDKTEGKRTIAEKTEKKEAKSAALLDFESRLNTKTGSITGPFDIVVSPTDKGASGHKYTQVPYVQFLGNVLIAFPSGERDRWGNGTFVYAVNYTLETYRKVNPAERRK